MSSVGCSNTPSSEVRGRAETGGGTDRTLWGCSPVSCILANGKTPPAFPTSENLSRYVKDFDKLRTKLEEFSAPFSNRRQP